MPGTVKERACERRKRREAEKRSSCAHHIATGARFIQNLLYKKNFTTKQFKLPQMHIYSKFGINMIK